MTQNTSIRLAQRPNGLPVADDWAQVAEPVPEPGANEFVVRISMISLDPAMRGWLDDRPSYLPPVGLGDVMRASAVGEIAASQHRRFPVGAWVEGAFGVQEFTVSNGRDVTW
jgi:hypothetical protein